MLHVEQTTTVEDDLLLAVLVKRDLEGIVLHNGLECGPLPAVSRAYLLFSNEPSDVTRFAERGVANKCPRSCFIVVFSPTSKFVHLNTYDAIFVCPDLEGKLDVRVYGRLDNCGEKCVGGVTKDRGRVDIVRGLPGLTGRLCACRECATATTKARLVASFERLVLECECRGRHEQRDEERKRPHRAERHVQQLHKVMCSAHK